MNIWASNLLIWFLNIHLLPVVFYQYISISQVNQPPGDQCAVLWLLAVNKCLLGAKEKVKLVGYGSVDCGLAGRSYAWQEVELVVDSSYHM